MNKFKNIKDIVEELEKDGESFPTYGQLISELEEIMGYPKVYAFMDIFNEHCEEFSSDFLEKEIDYEEKDSDVLDSCGCIIDQANNIYFFLEREETEEIRGEIREDLEGRGLSTEEWE